MSKVICEICGTTYQDSAECCPICGCPKDMSVSPADDELMMENDGKSGLYASRKKKEIFDFDEVNPGHQDDEEPYEEEEEYTEERSHNTFVVIFLTALIVVLLAITAFLFLRFLLPNLLGEEQTVPTVVTEQVPVPEEETTEPRIPCQSLSLPGGAAELNQPGYYFLLNVVVIPEDTTDELVFTSGDESIATVSADGRITAVSEGKTVIYITCGDKQLSCPVTCHFEEETEPPTEEALDAETQAIVETTAETLAPVDLKLNKTDVRLMVGYSFQLELVDCGDLKPEDVEWSVEHSYIAKVENGYVTALQGGTTVITAKYGEQTATCIIRCYY